MFEMSFSSPWQMGGVNQHVALLHVLLLNSAGGGSPSSVISFGREG